jgi:predicted branched-subunit amino acid permease
MKDQERAKPLPGVAAIGLYMFLLCMLWLLAVSMHKMPKSALLFAVAFAVAGQGLLRLKRWGWAMTLAAIFISMVHSMWSAAEYHTLWLLGVAAFDMVLFLYLIRPEVRARLR